MRGDEGLGQVLGPRFVTVRDRLEGECDPLGPNLAKCSHANPPRDRT